MKASIKNKNDGDILLSQIMRLKPSRDEENPRETAVFGDLNRRRIA